MARKALDIGIRLERQEKKILKLRQELEEAQDLYEKNCLRLIRKASGAWMRS